MKYLEIFNEVVSIMHNDYSGCIDNKGGDNPEEYEEIIKELEEKNQLDDENFTCIVQDYIAYFEDYHVNFYNFSKDTIPLNLGFQLRKYKNKLYVVKNTCEDRLEIGDAIVEVDGMNVEELHERHKRRLFNQPDERQLFWHEMLSNYKEAIVEKINGERIKLELKKYEYRSVKSKYTLEFIKDGIALFILEDFQNDEAIRNLLEDNKERLECCKKWIIDVRNNGGGNDIAFLPLMNYILEDTNDINLDEDTHEYLMTERNCNGRIKSWNEYLLQGGENLESGVKDFIIKVKDFYAKNKEKGFVKMDVKFDDAFKFSLKSNPKKVVILTDVECGSSGDQFVLASSISKKVITVGRNTLGIIDYSNCNNEIFDKRFGMMYPTSRDVRVSEGKGIKGRGIAPDIYIPWTPEMLERDIDMEKAFETLNE